MTDEIVSAAETGAVAAGELRQLVPQGSPKGTTCFAMPSKQPCSASHLAEPVEGSLMLPGLVALAGGCGGLGIEFEVAGLAVGDNFGDGKGMQCLYQAAGVVGGGVGTILSMGYFFPVF